MQTINADEADLRMVQRADPFVQARFQLLIRTPASEEFQVLMSGLVVGDIVRDARDAGVPSAEELDGQWGGYFK